LLFFTKHNRKYVLANRVFQTFALPQSSSPPSVAAHKHHFAGIRNIPSVLLVVCALLWRSTFPESTDAGPKMTTPLPPPGRPRAEPSIEEDEPLEQQRERSAIEELVKKNAYVEGLVRTAPTLTYDHFKAAIINMPYDACVRKSFYWGCGVGALLGLHRFKQGGTVLRSIRSFSMGLGFTFITQFYFCRRNEFETKVALRKFQEGGNAKPGASASQGSLGKIGEHEEEHDGGSDQLR
jgi:hypothetical protein